MNNSTKKRKFLADNALLFFHPQVYDFLIPRLTVAQLLRTRLTFFFLHVHLPRKKLKELGFGVGYLRFFNFNVEVEDGHLKKKKCIDL